MTILACSLMMILAMTSVTSRLGSTALIDSMDSSSVWHPLNCYTVSIYFMERL